MPDLLPFVIYVSIILQFTTFTHLILVRFIVPSLVGPSPTQTTEQSNRPILSGETPLQISLQIRTSLISSRENAIYLPDFLV